MMVEIVVEINEEKIKEIEKKETKSRVVVFPEDEDSAGPNEQFFWVQTVKNDFFRKQFSNLLYFCVCFNYILPPTAIWDKDGGVF